MKHWHIICLEKTHCEALWSLRMDKQKSIPEGSQSGIWIGFVWQVKLDLGPTYANVLKKNLFGIGTISRQYMAPSHDLTSDGSRWKEHFTSKGVEEDYITSMLWSCRAGMNNDFYSRNYISIWDGWHRWSAGYSHSHPNADSQHAQSYYELLLFSYKIARRHFAIACLSRFNNGLSMRYIFSFA